MPEFPDVAPGTADAPPDDGARVPAPVTLDTVRDDDLATAAAGETAQALAAPIAPGQSFEEALQAALVELGRRHLPSGVEVMVAAQMGFELEQQEAVAKQLGENSLVYQHATKEQLIDACLDRDAILINLRRKQAEGRLNHALMREFVRAVLTAAEAGDKQYLQGVLESVGGGKVDLRQLMIKGTTL